LGENRARASLEEKNLSSANLQPQDSHVVLVVDDDPDILEALSEILEAEGFEIRRARNGKEALDRLEPDPPKLILLDLMMPVMDGWEFRRQQVSHAAFSKIPVIVFSAAGRERMRQVDANDYLAKPVDLDELLQRVSRFCSRDSAD
jgi:two-component system, chemotaxis family, chemotaxis protein CheY